MDFWKYLGFCPNQGDPPPFPERWDTSQKNDVYCILGYSVLEKFEAKKLGSGRPPRTQVGTESPEFPKIRFEGSP